MAEGIKIAEGCEFREAGVVNNDVETSKFLYRLLDEANTILYYSDVLF